MRITLFTVVCLLTIACGRTEPVDYPFVPYDLDAGADAGRELVACVDGELTPTPAVPAVMLVVDRSGSMNFDFAALANKVHRQSPLPFVVFYSQQIAATAEGVTVSRLFSLPVEGHAQGTWAEPISDEMLDPDVGLILEANVR